MSIPEGVRSKNRPVQPDSHNSDMEATLMVKDKHEDDKDKRVLATGASGDPAHPEAGAPVGATVYQEEELVTDTETQAKTKADTKDKDEK